MNKILFCAVTLLLPFLASAELDSASQDALDKTVQTLKDPVQRQESFGKNANYKQGESAANMLVGGNDAQKQQLYEMAAEVLKNLAQKANGDPVRMQEIVSQAQKNPSQFMEQYFSEEQKKQVRDLASQIEKDRQPKPPQPHK